jgi:membrane protease YdiL (CAAX protease family)
MATEPDRRTPRSVIVVLVGLAIALVIPSLGLGGRLAPGDGMDVRMIREGVVWALTIALIAYILLVERRPLSSIGLRRPTWKSFAFAIPAAILLMAVIMVCYAVIFPALGLHGDPGGTRKAILATPIWYRLLLVIRAGVTEEIAYRGYTIERVGWMSGSRWLGALVSVVAFTAAHFSSWGLVHLIPVAVGGVIFAGFYLWRRDLWSNIFAHILTDGAGFLFG